jgi:hypothetical protein
MNEDKEEAWEKFKKTGKIKDYLKYVKIKKEEE